MKKILLISFMLLAANFCLAQTSKTDSLKKDLNSYTKKDTARIIKLLRYAQALYQNNQPDESILYAKQAIELAKRIKWDKGKAEGLIVLADIQGGETMYAESAKSSYEAIKILENIPGNKMLLLNAYRGLGETYRLIGNDSLALIYDKKSLDLAYASNDENQILQSMGILATTYSEKEDWKNLDTILARAFAIPDIRKYKRAYIRLNGLKADEMISHQKDTTSAIGIYREIISDCNEIKYFHFMAYTQSVLSHIYTLKKRKDSAYYFGKSALEAAKKYNLTKELNDANSALFAYYYAFGNYKEALKYRLLYDSIYQKSYNAKAIQNAENARNQFEQEKKDALSKLEQEKKDAKTKRTRDMQFTVLAIFLLITVFFYWSNRQKQKAKTKIEKAYSELKSTQAQLIQSEKMASLGELTAGIAHEIQNPLNFVNNFSDVNKELLVEMKEEMDKGNTEDAKAIANDVIANEEKINHHGKRADAIVKGMLQHSKKTSGQKEPTDINALADEYLRLSYHGLRAKDKTFNAEIKTDFDGSIGKINVIPQDIGRVLLNLFNNAFYAVTEQKNKNLISYEPTVSVITKKSHNHVIITVSDNGNGIPQNIVDKIFQPFFTTKPTGEGTGLGLSLAYDIIKAHGGELKVESNENIGTVFTVQLPL